MPKTSVRGGRSSRTHSGVAIAVTNIVVLLRIAPIDIALRLATTYRLVCVLAINDIYIDCINVVRAVMVGASRMAVSCVVVLYRRWHRSPNHHHHNKSSTRGVGVVKLRTLVAMSANALPLLVGRVSQNCHRH